MRIWDSGVGYFVCFQNLLKTEKKMRIIKFEKIKMWDDFKLMHKRIEQANNIYNDYLLKFSIK